MFCWRKIDIFPPLGPSILWIQLSVSFTLYRSLSGKATRCFWSCVLIGRSKVQQNMTLHCKILHVAYIVNYHSKMRGLIYFSEIGFKSIRHGYTFSLYTRSVVLYTNQNLYSEDATYSHFCCRSIFCEMTLFAYRYDYFINFEVRIW